MDFLRSIKGEIFAKMIHQDGSSEEMSVPNIVVERASILIARLLIGEALPTGATFQDYYGNNTIEKVRGITHLAMGIGKPFESYNATSGLYEAESGDDITDVLNVQGLPQEWDKQNPPGSCLFPSASQSSQHLSASDCHQLNHDHGDRCKDRLHHRCRCPWHRRHYSQGDHQA